MRRRVFQLIKGLGRGGAERLLPQVIAHGAGGFEYAVGYLLPHKDDVVPEIRRAGAEVVCLGAGGRASQLRWVPAVARWLRRGRADLLHCHLPIAGVVGRLAGRLAGVPVVYTEHNLLEHYRAPTRWADVATWRLQRAVVAVSGEVAESARRHAGTAVPVRVIHNGIDLALPTDPAATRRVARAGWDLADDAKVIGTVAVLRRQKRLDRWLEAARTVAAEDPQARFLLVGDGPLRQEIAQRAAELGIAEKCRFTGLRRDVPALLAAMDVFLVSSDYEGLPLAVLEAMAAGLPVVAPSVGGVPEAVIDGETGRLAPPGDVEALARAVLTMVRDPAQAARMGAAGRARVAERFSVARMAAELESLYREVLDGRP